MVPVRNHLLPPELLPPETAGFACVRAPSAFLLDGVRASEEREKVRSNQPPPSNTLLDPGGNFLLWFTQKWFYKSHTALIRL